MSLISSSSPDASPPRGISRGAAIVAVVIAVGLTIGALAIVIELHPFGWLTPASPSSPSNPQSVTVVDDLGRSVTAPWNATRVIVLGPSVLDPIYRLGLRSHVVGVDCSSAAAGGLLGDYTSNQTELWGLDSSMCVQAYPSPVTEELLNLSPTLVLAPHIISSSSLEEFSITFGIPVVLFAPTTLGGIVSDVQLLAQLFPVQSVANQLIAQLQQTLVSVQNFVTNLTDNGTSFRSVLLTYYVTPSSSPNAGYYAYGPDTFGQSLLEIAGASSVSASALTPYPLLSGSQVLADDPSVVICGTGFGIDAPQYAQGPDWSMIPAVQNGNVSYVDSTLITESDPSMILWIPSLQHLLYPTLPGA